MKPSQYHGIIAHIMLLGLAYALVNEENLLILSFSFLILYNVAASIFLTFSKQSHKTEKSAVSRNKSK